jgi:2-dehydro-3-deoxygalactonokinase
MIGVDWGTSSFRAYRLAKNGRLLETRESARGIATVEGGDFAATLKAEIGDWLSRGEDRVMLSGMIGSRQGWIEAPYVDCPAGLEDIARATVPLDALPGIKASIAPGLRSRDDFGVPDLLRGEETQILGALKDLPPWVVVLLPGTHCKHIEVAGGRILRFKTYMTGEIFAALKDHTILARTVAGEAPDDGAFLDGVRRAASEGGLLHHVFGVRARYLVGELAASAQASYLSGLVIGHELAAAGLESEVALIGAPNLLRLYDLALRELDIPVRNVRPDAAARGLYAIAQAVG